MSENQLTPLHLQAAEKILSQIKNGTFREGEVLPRMNQLSRIFHINASAMERGLQYLVGEHFLIQKSAIEYVVNQGALDILLKESRKLFFSERLPAVLKEAADLGISQEEILRFLSGEEEKE